jgi:hypothetical protein
MLAALQVNIRGGRLPDAEARDGFPQGAFEPLRPSCGIVRSAAMRLIADRTLLTFSPSNCDEQISSSWSNINPRETSRAETCPVPRHSVVGHRIPIECRGLAVTGDNGHFVGSCGIERCHDLLDAFVRLQNLLLWIASVPTASVVDTSAKALAVCTIPA